MLQDFIKSSVESSPLLCNLLNHKGNAWKRVGIITGIITLKILVQKSSFWLIDKHKIVWGIITQVYFTRKVIFFAFCTALTF